MVPPRQNRRDRYMVDLVSTGLAVPDYVELEGAEPDGVLVWDWWEPIPDATTASEAGNVPLAPAQQEPWEPVRRSPSPQILAEFIRLADAPRVAIRTFVERWGPLHLCEHDLPATHCISFSAPGPRFFLDGCADAPAESIAVWRRFAAQARAITNIAAALQRGEVGAISDWAVLHAGEEEPVWWDQSVGSDWGVLEAHVKHWLLVGGVRPTFGFKSRGRSRDLVPVIQLGGYWLFGELANQLAMMVLSADSVLTCDGCSRSYQPLRKPVEGRRHFCVECGTRAGNRLSKRAAAAAKRAKSGA